MNNKNTISIQGPWDFKEFLSYVSDECANLILTDPPYNISQEYGFSNKGAKKFQTLKNDFGVWDHKEIDTEILANEMYRILVNGGTAIVFYDIWKFNKLANNMKKAGFKILRLIIWEKTNPVPVNARFGYLSNAREVAVFGVKKGNATFNGYYDNGFYKHPIPNGKDRIHPTQKPLKLINELILKHSNENDFVIDPFLGSGTTAYACALNNRKFWGSDSNNNYIEMARQRINKLNSNLL